MNKVCSDQLVMAKSSDTDTSVMNFAINCNIDEIKWHPEN